MSRHYFWISKLRAEFPAISLPADVTQARKSYLDMTVFNGEVYKEGQLKHSGPILYSDIEQWVNNIGDVVFFSRESWNKDNVDSPFDFHVLGARWVYNAFHLGGDRPTQVDIVTRIAVENSLGRGANMLWMLNYKGTLSAIDERQHYDFPTVDLFGVTGTQRIRGDEFINEVTRLSASVAYLLAQTHSRGNSPVYQKYTNDMYQRALINLSSPKIPVVYQVASIQQRKALVMQQLEDSGRELLDYGEDMRYTSGYSTYDKFIEAQNVAVNALTDEQLTALEHMLQVLKSTNVGSRNPDKDRTISGIFFNTRGELRMHVD